MVRAGMAQDGDSVVPFTMWVFAVPSTMLLQNQDNISLWCSSTSVCIRRAHFRSVGRRQETCKIFPVYLCQSQAVGKDQNL